MVRRDAHPGSQTRLECQECIYSTTDRTHPPHCPRCGGALQTVSVSTDS